MPTLQEVKNSEWYKVRPAAVKKLICKFPPFSSVLIIRTQQRAYMYSYFDDETMKVVIDPAENKSVGTVLNSPYSVFGYKQKELKFICENPELFIECE